MALNYSWRERNPSKRLEDYFLLSLVKTLNWPTKKWKLSRLAVCLFVYLFPSTRLEGKVWLFTQGKEFLKVFLDQLSTRFSISKCYHVRANLGSSCSTAVEHTPGEQNSWGQVFKSRRVLGFFSSLLYPISCAFLIQVPHRGATLLIFL